MQDDDPVPGGDCSGAAAPNGGTFPSWLPSGGRALAATAAGIEGEIAPAYERALDAGARPAQLGEVAGMAHLFGGYPRAIQGLHHLHGVAEHRQLSTPLLRIDEDSASRAEHGDRGLALFLRIYGDGTPRVLETLKRTLGGYDRLVLEHAYGRVLARPGLGGRERELIAVAALAVLDCPVQLFSHARGALALGADPPFLRAMVDAVLDLLDHDGARRVAAVLAKLSAAP